MRPVGTGVIRVDASPAAVPWIGGASDVLHGLGLSQRYLANSEIVAEGAAAGRIYRVLSGAVRTVRFMEDGRRQIGGFYLPGEVLGLGVSDRHTFAAEAIGDTDVAMMKLDHLKGSLTGALWRMTVAELERAQDHFLTLGRRTASERVAWFLLDMAARAGQGGTIELPMCRQDIGDFLGLTIETVSRVMTRFERAGLIALPAARRIVLLNRSALLGLEG